jgi:integrase
MRKQAELPALPFHGLRHSHATELLRSGIPAYIVAKRLGDEVQKVLKTYAHALKEDDQLSANSYAEKIQNA